MESGNAQRILIATDGSPSAHAAMTTAMRIPWPENTVVRVVISELEWLRGGSSEARAAAASATQAVADAARNALAERWSPLDVVVRNAAPAEAILTEAREWGATLVVMGWRGHGAFERLLAGSVSRTVAASAPCPVLVVPAAPARVERWVLGFDGSPFAERALEFLGGLRPTTSSAIVAVSVVEPLSPPASTSLLPSSVRAVIQGEVSRENERRAGEAQALVEGAAHRLSSRGWNAKADVRFGAPLKTLLAAVDEHRADILVLGARAVSGVERMLLGSVANGALNARLPVMLVR